MNVFGELVDVMGFHCDHGADGSFLCMNPLILFLELLQFCWP